MPQDKDAPKNEAPAVEVEESQPEQTEPADRPASKSDTQPVTGGGSHKEKFISFLKSTKGKIVLAVLGVVVIAGVLFAVPATRYGILGKFIQRDIAVHVVDAGTGNPVSEVDVSVATGSGKTDAGGKLILTVPVGVHNLSATKNYYNQTTQKVEVGLWGTTQTTVELEATGRQVPVKVLNKVGGAAVQNATLTAEDAVTTTNAQGEAVLVVPADKKTIAATVKTSGFNDSTIEITVTEQKDDKNIFSITPSGTVYFLSKRTGKIDVMKSDLDGSNAKVVLAGTGKESENETSLLTSRDWKYQALHARREGDKAKLYLIDTTKGDELSVIDEGDASFQLLGWFDNRLAYVVDRNNVQHGQAKRVAVKSFDATARKITVLEENKAESIPGDAVYAWFGSYYLVKDGLLFTKQWVANSSVNLAGKKITVFRTGLSGENKKVIKEFDEKTENGLDARLYEPEEVYYRYKANFAENTSQFFEYENGVFKDAPDASNATFEKEYPTFLIAPSGNQSLWSESRDGKRRVYVGDANAGDAKEIFTGEDYLQYGWYGEDYVFVSKNRSELFIMPKTGGTPLKVTDYHRPDYTYSGYGYGYGGF